MMPRWLSVWLGLTLGIIWFIGITAIGSYSLSALTRTSERPFTIEQQSYLQSQFPGGTLIAPSQYKWCDGRIFMYFDSRGDQWHHGETCWKVQ